MPFSFADISGVKILGRAIGSLVDRAAFDGDGDGFLTGRDGRDNVPAPKVVQHGGEKFLEAFEAQRGDLEKVHGDLRDPKNVIAAFGKTFPNMHTFELVDAGQSRLTDFEFARAVSLLHLGRDKRVAAIIDKIGWLPEHEVRAGTNAACGVIVSADGVPRIEHHLVFSPIITRAPRYRRTNATLVDGGWGDYVASEMVKNGASDDEIDRFWGFYLVNHEWVHAEHRLRSAEHAGRAPNMLVADVLREIVRSNGGDVAAHDEKVREAVELLKTSRPGLSDEEAENTIILSIMSRSNKDVANFLHEGLLDDLSPGEINQLGGRYPLQVSPYAAVNFNELVAEKGSALRMGQKAGADNPAWRKFYSWLYPNQKDSSAVDVSGLSRQQRRALERNQRKKKDALSDDVYRVVSARELEKARTHFIFNMCEGFTHLNKIATKHSVSDVTGVKILGASIGSASRAVNPAQFDGDGDGFVTGVNGEDNIPAPVARPAFSLRGRFGAFKRFGIDEAFSPPDEFLARLDVLRRNSDGKPYFELPEERFEALRESKEFAEWGRQLVDLYEGARDVGTLKKDTLINAHIKKFVRVYVNRSAALEVFPERLDGPFSEMSEHIEKNPIVFNMGLPAFAGLMADGSYKNADIGDQRKAVEAGVLGVPFNFPPQRRPIYGSIDEPDRPYAAAEGYGGVRVVLKRDVKKRATFTPSDTGGSGGIEIASPVDSPLPLSSTLDGKGYSPYIEAQIFGGITLDDVEEIILPANLNKETRDEAIKMIERNKLKWRTAERPF